MLVLQLYVPDVEDFPETATEKITTTTENWNWDLFGDGFDSNFTDHII